MRKLKIDRAIYIVDDASRTYRYGRRNRDWRALTSAENERNKRHLVGYTRIFPDGRRRKFTYRPPYTRGGVTMGSPIATGARGHRTIEHTADTGIEAWGPTLAAAFEEGALGLYELMLDPATIVERESRFMTVTGVDDGDLLVRWLTELLYLVDAEGLVFRRVVIERMSPHELVAIGHGERLDAGRHRLRTAVKAATYHQLYVDARPPARVRVLLDI